jgi:hypothetical protein
MTTSVPLRTAVDIPDNRLALVATDAVGGMLQFAEHAGGVWSTPQSLGVTNPIVIGAGYAGDGTAWVLYGANGPSGPSGTSEELFLQRRTGSVWQSAATHVLGAGQSPSYGGGTMTAASPDGKSIVVVWGSNSGFTDQAQGVVINLTNNTFGPITTLLTITVSTINFSTSVSLSADGTHGNYVLGSADGRAWTGTYDSTNKTFGAATPFHPELSVGREPRVVHNSCDQPLVVYSAGANSSAPFDVYIDSL